MGRSFQHLRSTRECRAVSGGPENPETKAARLGRRVVYPGPDQLFIDIDSDEQLVQHLRVLAVLVEHGALQVSTWSKAPSPSGQPGHAHVTVQLATPMDERERIFMQAMLRTDPVREALSFVQLRAGEPSPVVFFELPDPASSVDPMTEMFEP